MKIIFGEKADAIYIYLIEPSKKRGINLRQFTVDLVEKEAV